MLKAERRAWVAETKVMLLVRWVEDSFWAEGLGAQLKRLGGEGVGVLLIHAVSGDNE